MIELPSLRVMDRSAQGSLSADDETFKGYVRLYEGDVLLFMWRKKENYYVLARGSVVLFCDDAARDMTKELRV